MTHGLTPVSKLQTESASSRPPACEGLNNSDSDSDFDQLGEAFDDCVKSSLASRGKTSLRMALDKGAPRQGSWGVGREVN